MPEILHVNSYYITNKLHGELVSKLDERGWQQYVFVPVSRNIEICVNEVKDLRNTVFFYKKAFNRISRLIWPVKMWMIYKAFWQIVRGSSNPEIIHSHSLIVNGFIACRYNKKTKTPYVVTVRNTDINIFLTKSYIFRRIGEYILNHASAVLFLSPAYRDIQLKKNISSDTFKKILPKTFIVPNGINDFWLENVAKEPNKLTESPVRIIFSGKLRENKNLKGLIEACERLNSIKMLVSLDIVGEGPLKPYLSNLKTSTKIKLHGFISDKKQLASIYRSCHIMVVPSFRESFGLIYAEGMSQGLPAIYTKGQGFDGFFKDGEIGYAVNPHDTNDIANKIKKVIDNYDELSHNALEKVTQFSWNYSITKLNDIYLKAILSNKA